MQKHGQRRPLLIPGPAVYRHCHEILPSQFGQPISLVQVQILHLSPIFHLVQGGHLLSSDVAATGRPPVVHGRAAVSPHLEQWVICQFAAWEWPSTLYLLLHPTNLHPIKTKPSLTLSHARLRTTIKPILIRIRHVCEVVQPVRPISLLVKVEHPFDLGLHSLRQLEFRSLVDHTFIESFVVDGSLEPFHRG